MLSDILEEQILVKSEQHSAHPNGYSHVAFGSTKSYRVSTGAAHAAKGGGLVSGDSYSMMELGRENMRPRSVTAWAMGRGPIMRAMKRLSCSKNSRIRY